MMMEEKFKDQRTTWSDPLMFERGREDSEERGAIFRCVDLNLIRQGRA